MSSVPTFLESVRVGHVDLLGRDPDAPLVSAGLFTFSLSLWVSFSLCRLFVEEAGR